MKICFWGDIAKALSGNTSGGGELQIALLAKALAKCGHEIVVIDYNIDQDFVSTDGIKFKKITGWNRGAPIIRSFSRRLFQLYKILKEQKADIYYCRIRDFRHILAYWAARKVKGKFVLSLASDLDAMSFAKRFRYQHMVSAFNLWAFISGILIELTYPFLLKRANLLLVQHEGQYSILKNKHTESLIFPNLIECRNYAPPAKQSDNYIYVGSLDRRKGFRSFFELITKTPTSHYTIVGQPRDKTARTYYHKLKKFDNVVLMGRLSHDETINQIAASKALISTSPMEGFPNVFIEAWTCGIPVLSLHNDPGSTIVKNELGIYAKRDLNVLIAALKDLTFQKDFAEKSRKYVEITHAMTENRIVDINNIFTRLKQH